jgi:hypothetical protein
MEVGYGGCSHHIFLLYILSHHTFVSLETSIEKNLTSQSSVGILKENGNETARGESSYDCNLSSSNSAGCSDFFMPCSSQGFNTCQLHGMAFFIKNVNKFEDI